MHTDISPLSKTVTQAPSLQLAHSAAPVVLRDKLIDLQLVCPIVCAKKSTIYAWLKDPASDFPRPVRLSARMVRWSEAAVLQWVQNRINQAEGVQ
jgi:predicted DNA-binding transcriptional regulator AlpA